MRHRLLLAAIDMLDGFNATTLFHGKRILHFAPEPFIVNRFKSVATSYVSADVRRGRFDLQLDIGNMSSVPDGAFDLVMACDVLEHVVDDSAALREISRVLATPGWAVITVPQGDGLGAKLEDPSVTTLEGRLQAFGQGDHLRIYGNDFDRVLESHGFTVTVVDERAFEPHIVRQYVLCPPLPSTHPLATNHRRIYFAAKGTAPSQGPETE